MTSLVALCITSVASLGLCGCNSHSDAPKPAPSMYDNLGYKPDLPDVLRGTVFERTNLANTDPYPISGYSVVVNLQGTGDNSNIPSAVRQSIIKAMVLRGVGSKNQEPQMASLQPEDMLKDKRVAIVQAEGRLPVGARQGQRFDVVVRAMPRSNTSSLAGGHLWQTELRNLGKEQPSGGGQIFAYADDGDVFVNPAYALGHGGSPAVMAASLRSGVVMGSGRVTLDRPIFLQLRVPQASISRSIEQRIINRFQQEQDRPAAAAQDDGIVSLYVPVSFGGDWEHFVGVVNHLYLNDSPEFNAQKAHQLVAAAQKPGAPLTDISFCMEGLGEGALPTFQPLVNHPDPAVAFAAARAAVFLGDRGALEALVQMATDANHPFQLAAIHAIGSLPGSPAVDKSLEPLLSSEQALVRIEAYKILAAHGDRMILTEKIGDARHPNDGFLLDVVQCGGPPLVYATRAGVPRLAVFGRQPMITPPIMFSAKNDRLTISSNEFGDRLTLFYRSPLARDPVRIESRPGLAEVAARLGGRGPEGEPHLDFSYGDVVAILQSLSETHRVAGSDGHGQITATPFILEKPPELEAALANAAKVDSRPQGDPVAPPGHVPASVPAPAGSTPGTQPPGAATPAPSFDGRPAGDSTPPAGTGSAGSASSGVPAFGN